LQWRQDKIGKGAADGISCQRPKSKGGTPRSLPQSAPARSRDLAVILSILRRYITRLGGCRARAKWRGRGRAGGSGRMKYDVESFAGSRRNEIARE
jgi:hypothetical protein